jgi:Na+:H+ antiporter, NhaA family
MSEQGRASSGGVLDWFIHSAVAGSAVLLASTAAAMVWANSPWAASYVHLAHTTIAISIGTQSLALSLQHWINDALMVIFFFVVGLEIKRELVVGHLSSVRRAILPVAAAAGGMICPAVLYALLNAGGPGADGWGIPMATDIAFALGILALLGDRVPVGLKVFLTALAIADDLGAVLVIAVFYTAQIRWFPLGAALVCLLFLAGAIRAGVRHPVLYGVLAIGVWLSVLLSGIHATVAGILVAMLVPVRPRLSPAEFLARTSRGLDQFRAVGFTRDSGLADEAQLDALVRLEEAASEMRPPGLTFERFLHPLQTFFVLPLFAFVNAGVSLGGRALDTLAHPIALGVMAGLVLGKVIGVSLTSWLAVRMGLTQLPERVTWPQLVGAGLLAGVGFTMSLFVSELAFASEPLLNAAKLGILVASLAAGLLGYVVLRVGLPRPPG